MPPARDGSMAMDHNPRSCRIRSGNKQHHAAAEILCWRDSSCSAISRGQSRQCKHLPFASVLIPTVLLVTR